KYAGYVSQADYHFMTSEKLGQLKIDKAVATRGDLAKRSAQPPDEAEVQEVLDLMTKKDPSDGVAKAIASHNHDVRKAGFLVLAKRPEVTAPTKVLTDLCASYAEGTSHVDTDILTYALVALAERKQLRANEWFDLYNRAPDPQLRLTWVWCCG